jgi:outer membrane cobalamin receptor
MTASTRLAVNGALVTALITAPITAAPAALADPILDSCVVRRIQQTDQRMRISVDLDRKDVEAYLRTAATTALADYPGVTIDRITISRGGSASMSI